MHACGGGAVAGEQRHPAIPDERNGSVADAVTTISGAFTVTVANVTSLSGR